MPPLTITFLCNKANTFGIRDDLIVLERALQQVAQRSNLTLQKPRIADLREPPIASDIQIHLEIPVFAAIPWSFVNVLWVNADHWSPSYDAYLHAFDLLLFRDSASATTFREKGIPSDKIHVIPWCSSWTVKEIDPLYVAGNVKNGLFCMVGGSDHKAKAVQAVLSLWTEEDPRLTIYTTREDLAASFKALPSRTNVEIVCQELTDAMIKRISTLYTGHLIVSEAESFGYAAAHAEVTGAFAIMSRLPCFTEQYGDSSSVAWLPSPSSLLSREDLDRAIQAFREMDNSVVRRARQKCSEQRLGRTVEAFTAVMRSLSLMVQVRKPKGIHHLPPILDVADCPPITVITPTYHRKQMMDIAFHNMLSTDYPKKKMEWIVIEDNEKRSELATEKIVGFQVQHPEIQLKYIPIEGRMSIGEKRNLAVEQASHEIILFMDDDDHYPVTSFRRRVAWLLKGQKGGFPLKPSIACCTTLALYDLKRGVSAVNVPPMDLPLAQRISEATLTFFTSAWRERRFPSVSLSEGEEWIKGREEQVIEIPPQQIIVAFSHGGNQSSRRIPPSDQPPSCFWGFPREYLIFIHRLAGVEVEETPRGRR